MTAAVSSSNVSTVTATQATNNTTKTKQSELAQLMQLLEQVVTMLKELEKNSQPTSTKDTSSTPDNVVAGKKQASHSAAQNNQLNQLLAQLEQAIELLLQGTPSTSTGSKTA